jgi:hypothetical protein
MEDFMRALIAGSLVLISFAFLPLASPPVLAQEACRCKGCGCKGGPGWRGPEGTCVSAAKLAQICGTAAGAPCKQEAAERVCFGNGTAQPEAQAKTVEQ